jgi:hypothetical protein
MKTRLLLAGLLLSSACDSDDGGPAGESTTTAPMETGSDASSSSGDTGEAVDPQVEMLCNCMLLDCHEAYHERYGASDLEAAAACNAEGAMLAADEVTCRLTACQSGECDVALGDTAPCT